MVKKTVTYNNYLGQEKTRDFYFNLTKAELLILETSHKGGLTAVAQRAIDAEDQGTLVSLFKDLLLMSYGEISIDGEQFVKTKEVVDNFSYTEAFSILFTELATNSKAASAFIKGLVPTVEEVSAPQETAPGVYVQTVQ